MSETINWTIEIPVFTLAVIGLVVNLTSLFYKLVRSFLLPKLWKYSLVSLDAAHIFLGVGLVLHLIYKITNIESICKSISFFLQFGLFDCVSGYLIAGVILLGIYNPGKSSNLTSFHRNVFLVIFIPQKVTSIILSLLPLTPVSFFNFTSVNAISCLNIEQKGENAFSYGLLLVCICWIVIFVALICCIVSAVKLWKGFSNRIHSASPNVWQAQLVSQGRQIQKILIIEILVWIITLLVLTVINYKNTSKSLSASAVALILLDIATIFHGVLTNIGNSMWSICCCTSSQTIEETHRKLKQLELVRLEAPGKLRLRATWNAGKHHTRQGLMKVYGPKHVKSWAQEIVVLGMLRKIQHASLLQCLWTSSSNPYYETMTLITGEIVTSDSRIICLELTNSGTLQELIRRLESPLPESCQRMIIHDVAEGLYYLHDQNILHNNLNSSSIYLKGSLPSMVMRAAIGDFEDTQIFGAMQQTSNHSIRDKRNFFLPDIRSFALIALEIISNMCEKKFATYQYEWDQYINEKNVHNYPQTFYDDSDFEDEFYRHKPHGVRSPGEVIEDYKRSRSMSPGSRPLSAQSCRSQRSRTMSPDLSRSRHSPAVTLFGSREQTPEPMPKRSRSKSPFSKKHKKNRAPDPYDTNRVDSPIVSENEKQRKSTTPSKQKNADAFNNCKPQGKSKLKKVDSKKWMISKLKTITGSETAVSAFKPKTKSEHYDSNDEVSEEEIQTVRQKLHKKKRSDSKNSMQYENDHALHKSLSNQSNHSLQQAAHGDLYRTSSGSVDPTMYQKMSKDEKRLYHKMQGQNEQSVYRSMTGNSEQMMHRTLSGNSENMMHRTMSGNSENMMHRTMSGNSENMMHRTMSGNSENIMHRKMSGNNENMMHRTMSGNSENMMHRRMSGNSENMMHRTMSNHSDQWSILSDMEYPRSHGLRNTISQDSRASLWSNLPLPVEMIEENNDHLDEIIDCLPGMAETVTSQRKKNPQNKEHLVIRDKNLSMLRQQEYWKSDGPGTRRFELVDYYDELQGKFVKKMAPHPFYRSSSGSNMLPKSVHRTFSGTQILHRTTSGLQEITEATEVSDSDNENFRHDLDLAHKELKSLGHIIHPQVDNSNDKKPFQKIKPVFIKEDSEKQEEKTKDIIKPKQPKKKRSKSAEKAGNTRPEEQNESRLIRSESQKKKARATLQKKLTNRGGNVPVIPLSDRREKANLQVKYANVKKLKTQSNGENKENGCTDQNHTVVNMEDTKEQTSNHYEKFKSGVPRYSSFSSNDSGSSIDSSVRVRKANVSLTSGELTSLSSQADVDTDGHTTDLDLPFKENQMRKKLQMQSKARISDSGFDSESSELSSDYYRNHKGKKIQSRLPVHHEKSQVGLHVDELPFVSVDSGKMNFSETAFVLTGFENNHISPDQNDIDEEILPENDIVPNDYEDDLRPMSSMSRIIEVTCASPEDIKDLEDENDKCLSSKTGISGFKMGMSDSRPKTPSHSSRPKTASSLGSKELRGPNVYASPNVASKRYRELTKKGVPLRVSTITSDSPKLTDKGQPEVMVNETEDSGNVTDDQKLFNDLESHGFFKTTNTNTLSPPHKQHRKSRKDQPKRKKINKWKLDDIIREIPEESRSPSSSNRSPNHKSFFDDSFHNQSGEEAMLNQPHTSEDSETASVQNSAVNSIPSSGVPKQHQPSVVVDAELYIDRVYSNKPAEKQNGQVQLLDPDFDSPLNYERVYHPMSDMQCMNEYNENVDLDIDVPLLEGMNEKHVINCRKMTTQLNLVSFHDLLPANLENFTTLKTKLQQGGQLGNIGTQLLEIIHSCWLNELPPTSFDLVLQLTDPVTETEL
ncbi:uncharacterized protein LOC127698722 isoform X2 [Mytilus californianus]|uniref:uncharacterized protein LOC127698722 isoform X2 n=1 Tax=Mytilus californianus TaxID=6549 RepID=UPI002245D368|nr:uncharacterized protein LOC127698722 isoform X2 [Mytilus californianus]